MEELISVQRARWDGRKWRPSGHTSELGERVGRFFAIHRSVERERKYKYTVTHVATGWALVRVKTKSAARRAVRMAKSWPGIDWVAITPKSAQEEPLLSAGRALLVALHNEGLADDIQVVAGKVRRTI